ncbi:flagellar basal body-associated protein FliL [Methylobacter psychrophilus]|uniref:flagellar basal body-associated protein FliL n=1 Tax=Methylobacter psychrophilus TaxID=96941 RepID=UPI0021D4EFF1|nr:flagellar basal body-associated protein FliL [Methylobacter psychrophilus]
MSAQIPPENPPPQSKKLLWLVILLLIILIVGGGGAWYFLTHKAADKSEEHPDEEHQSSEQAGPPVFVEMLPFTVNLPPDGQFLQATFTLQLPDSSDAEHLTLYTPQIRSQILLLLSNKTADNLLLLEGKTLLTQEIMNLLKQPLDKGLKPIKVTHVFITSFIIQ